ncbi:tyrosine-protein phosphatase [Nocardia stercoris]|nr:tyrosine-protein phosphatase [Nocardia stercoris]
MSAGDHLGIDLPGVRNARGVGGLRTVYGRIVKNGRVFRSAGLHRLGDEGPAALSALDITTVLDLRSGEEVRRAPDEVGAAEVVQLSLHDPLDPDGEATVDAAAATTSLRDIYLKIVRERGEALAAGVREVAVSDGAAWCIARSARTAPGC